MEKTTERRQGEKLCTLAKFYFQLCFAFSYTSMVLILLPVSEGSSEDHYLRQRQQHSAANPSDQPHKRPLRVTSNQRCNRDHSKYNLHGRSKFQEITCRVATSRLRQEISLVPKGGHKHRGGAKHDCI